MSLSFQLDPMSFSTQSSAKTIASLCDSLSALVAHTVAACDNARGDIESNGGIDSDETRWSESDRALIAARRALSEHSANYQQVT